MDQHRMTGPEVRPEHEKTIESTKFVRIAERFKQGMRREVRSETRRENKKREVKGRRQIEISSSESESSSHVARPVTPIVTKAMPTKGETRRKKSDILEKSATASSASASASGSAENTAKERTRHTVKTPAAKTNISAGQRTL